MNTRVALRALDARSKHWMGRLGREVEPGAIDAILDLDNPKVGIKGDFPF
jgi:hypothetical protein